MTLTGTAMFYAGINLGFESRTGTELNQSMWLDACYDFVKAEKEYAEQQFSGAADGFYLPEEIREMLIPSDSLNENPPDSIFTEVKDSLSLKDSILAKDTVKIDSMALDSTARLEYFRYQREDKPYTSLERKRTSPFFASPTQKTRTIEIDSTGKFVLIKEKVGGQQTKILLRMSIDEYINLRMALKERETWEDLGYAYELKDTKKDLGGLIKDITDFEIPLPSVGVLSIFGEPKISLKIGGAVDIHGAWRSETTEGVTASRLGNTRNEPDFKQQVQINVNGTIGDKLNISADWNTERTFEYENQLKIKYTGYEDEIIQSIEAGNVSLQTSPLVGGSEALFGVKANFKMGPLSLTTLASQKKGEIKEVSVSGGATSQTFEIRSYQYSENNYFLDTIYASKAPDLNYFFRYYANATPEKVAEVEVIDIDVWKKTFTTVRDEQRERQANAYINLQPILKNERYPDNMRETIDPVPGEIETGYFIKLTPDVDYKLHPETGYITLMTSIQETDVIAVAFRRQGNSSSPDDDLFCGEFVTNVPSPTKLVLKLVKPNALQPKFKTAWMLQLRNIYSLGGKDIKEEGFDFRVKYEIEGQDPVNELPTQSGSINLLAAFGLDRYDANKQSVPDNKFDWLPGVTVLPQSGEIIFPYLEPFGEDLPSALPDTIAFTNIYDTQKVFASQVKIRDKWLLTGQYSGSATSRYNLGFNIVENSVKVRLSGRELTPGVDYTVDYNVGQLIIRNEAALVPGADLKITYEQNELFSLASKTLLGARGIFDFSRKTKLGFSILNLNEQTLTDKVRIGEEPLSNTIYGLDFQTSSELPFMTRLLDNVISTREMSNFSLSGEYAYIDPDPNTKKSTIVSDGGKSIAYIDDFEATKQIIPVGIGYTVWKDISVPDRLTALPDSLTKPELLDYKAKSFWFTATPSDVQVSHIWGDRKKVAKADEFVTVMDYVYIPDTPGTYNYYPKLGDPMKSWGGIMKLLSSTATNLVQENIEFIEFWANIDTQNIGSKIYIDLGRISEDVIPNRELDQEDLNSNDAIDEGEDTGLDGLFDVNEGNPTANPFLTEPVTRPDPSGDNFNFQGSINSRSWADYFSINGTEGNAVLTDIGRFPDTEDLNRNGQIDLVNSYFRYEVPLDTNQAANPYIVGGGDTPQKWYLFRIPLRESIAQVGDPNFTTVEMIRMFVTGTDKTMHLRIAEFNLVGNQWRKLEKTDSLNNVVEDSVLTLSVINYEDNPNYKSPPGVFQERDRTRPDEEVYRNEQSLNLIIKELPVGESREGVKYLARSLDVFNYTEMKLFVHGEENSTPGSISYFTNEEYAADVYFRFGGDSNNYYEYRQPVLPGWNEISILFSELTAIKQRRGDSTNQTVRIQVPDKPNHYYIVKGNPSLTAVKFLTVGIFNRPSSIEMPVSGEVWINELRVVGADDTPGWAYSLSSSMKFADLLNVNFNISQTNANFHKIADRFGSRVDATNWSVNADLDVLKLLPFTLNDSNLKINYTHTESVGKPVYVPGTDIKVEEAAQQLDKSNTDTLQTSRKTGKQLIAESQTINISDTWAVPNIKLKIPSNYWLIRDTFNSLSFGFNYNKSFMRSPTVLNNKSWVWNAQMNYGINLSPEYFLTPVKIPVLGSVVALFSDYRNVKVYYVPQSFSFTVSAKRNKAVNVNRAQGTLPVTQSITRDFIATRSFGFNWKLTEGGLLNLTTTYNFDVNSSLAYLETDESGNPRSEGQIWEDIFTGAHFGKDYIYRQNFDLKASPKLPSIWDISKYFTLTAGYSANYQWNNDFRQEELGRSASFSNRSSAGLTIRLKNLMAPMFLDEEEEKQPTQQRLREQEKKETVKSDSIIVPDSLSVTPKKSSINMALQALKSAVKYIFFDYENITVNFSNDNSLGKSGIKGKGTGLRNFWGLTFNEDYGPSRLFMLGLSNNVGSRAANGNLQDVFSQKNSLDFRTSRPLWEGAKIDLNWKVGWSINKTTTIRSDDQGNLTISSLSSTGTINRSFLSVPPVLIFSMFKNGIGKVNELYDPESPNPNASLSNAFLEGMETLPLLSKLGFLKDVAKYIPRPNWRINWDGLEKFALFKSAKRVSLEHAYTSSYTEGWKITPDGLKETQTQKIEYGFSPLAGLNFSFGEVWGGNLTASLKYNTRTSFDLGVSTKNITESFSRDIGVTGGYQKSGFEIPLFGLSLKNDIEFSFSYTSTKTSTILYNMNQFTEAGTPQDGTTRTTIEPRIKYTISSRVTLAIFYRRSSVEPEGAARIPPTTTNEAGLDVRISIQQ